LNKPASAGTAIALSADKCAESRPPNRPAELEFGSGAD